MMEVQPSIKLLLLVIFRLLISSFQLVPTSIISVPEECLPCILYAAAQRGHLNVVKLLVKKGASIHQASDQGVTPLHVAALEGHQEVVDYLMSKGATFKVLLLLQGVSGEGRKEGRE
jgi:hypothetical protein